MWTPRMVLILAIAISTVALVIRNCNALAPPNCTIKEVDCIGHQSDAGVQLSLNLSLLREQLCGCQKVNGSVIISLPGESNLTEDDFDFLYHLRSIAGSLTLENLDLAMPLVIFNLQRIDGNVTMTTSSSATLRVLDVSGGDVIFPNLTRIATGDAKFSINNSVCGYRSVNWSVILLNGRLNDTSDNSCAAIPCGSNCQTGNCWSQVYCQKFDSTNNPSNDDNFFEELWNDQRNVVIGAGAAIIVVLLVLCVVLICCCCYCCCCRRRRRRGTLMKAVNMVDVIDAGVRKYNSFTLTELPSLKVTDDPKDPPKQHNIAVLEPGCLELLQLLGNGSCGQMHKGYWHTVNDSISYLVAVKTFGTPLPNYRQILDEKLVKLSGLEHENVLRLCSVSYSSQLMLAYEFGQINLRHHLIHNKLTLSAVDLLKMATHVAKGMAYLHTKGISHGNLAARNVMVQHGSVAKVTDYNLFDLNAQSDWLPIRWLSPETLKYRTHNEKSDMWSYGVTVWEMMTFGAHPYHNKQTGDMLRALEGGERLQQPVTVSDDLHSVLLQCWWIDPKMRPSFAEMVKNMTTFQSNPSQYVLTMMDGNLETYFKLPPAVADINPHEKLGDIDEAGYLLMMSHVPVSPINSLQPPVTQGTPFGASISSDNVVASQIALAGHMSPDVRVEEQQYVPVEGTTDGEIYANPEPIDNEQEDTYDDPKLHVFKESENLYSDADNITEDELYVNPDKAEDELYVEVDKKDSSSDNEVEVPLPPKEINKQEQIHANDGGDKNTPEEELYINSGSHEAHISSPTSTVMDDTTVLLDHEDRGYERMKAGVSITNLHDEYAYAVQQDENGVEQSDIYVDPDNDGYEIMKRKKTAELSKGENTNITTGEDEYILLDRNSMLQDYRESQIYSSVQ